MAKAERNGVYTLNGVRFQINAGDVLPEGAELADEPTPDTGERARGAAPENKAKAAPVENRAKK